MSVWDSITDPEDIDISSDGTELEILTGYDKFGNIYIDMKLDMLLKRLRELKVIPELTETKDD